MNIEEQMYTQEQHMHWTPCERFTLSLLAQQRALTIEQLSCFLFLFEQKQWKREHPKSSAHTVVERLQCVGLVAMRHIGKRNECWFWLTEAGLRHVGIISPWRRPARPLLPALHAANTVYLTLSQQYPQGTWRSRQQLKKARSTDLPPSSFPTAEYELDERTCIAIQIVLRIAGTDEQIASRMRQHLQQESYTGKLRYTSLWYYATTTAAKRLRTAYEKSVVSSMPEIANKVTLFSYPLVPKESVQADRNFL